LARWVEAVTVASQGGDGGDGRAGAEAVAEGGDGDVEGLGGANQLTSQTLAIRSSREMVLTNSDPRDHPGGSREASARSAAVLIRDRLK
jgi:hypothetical protein